ncbi:MAG TPA: phosphomannomutase [Candidatus Ozemobacteraceae bacterium]|nr:phosphomannomutase [Candidatus Ozemobacteraceae bacterium]
MPEKIRIADLMDRSGVGFGTSGARGLVASMTDRVCYAYTAGFLRHLETRGEISVGARFALAGDLRPSTPRIMRACAMAARNSGYLPINGGAIPTPALTAWGIDGGIASAMVTGSHIPDDRNGIKFNRPAGEILKEDEAGIRAQEVILPDVFDETGALKAPEELPPEAEEARRIYIKRYIEFFPSGCLSGMRIGVYEHSGVARDILVEVLERLGAEVVRLARSETFIPVDTEAVRPEDVALARDWAAGGRYFALCSTDGDGDRPLVGNERGEWIRGDVAGILAAKWLGANTVVTPVSSNTAVEKCGWFDRVVRTRIGSPYVISAMQAAEQGRVVGYEANGGFLIQSPIELEGRLLAPLPTRDALIVILALLRFARERDSSLSELTALLPARYTASGRLETFPSAIAKNRIAALARDGGAERTFSGEFGPIAALDETDGLRMTFANGEIIHLRPSGNAPELRCYNEAETPERAEALNRRCLEILAGWR